MTERSHTLYRFLQEQDAEGLRALSILLSAIVTNKRMGVYFQGMVDGLMRDRHDVCPVHGVNHDAEALSKLDEGSATPGDSDSNVPMSRGEYEELLHKYELEEHEESGRLYCRNCGLVYVSLDDRMLRAPGRDGCHGCHIKDAQG